jgi:hypothetical protein
MGINLNQPKKTSFSFFVVCVRQRMHPLAFASDLIFAIIVSG